MYKPIKKTIFLERKHAKLAVNEIMVCSCKEPIQITSGPYARLFTRGCGKKCLNRVMSTECSVSLCPTGEMCTNRRFQLQKHVQLYPIKTEGRGWGLSAAQFIRKGQFVIQYLGEVYSIDSEIGEARLEKYKSNPCTYLMSTSHNEVIDPARKGNLARFINHSCDPNCETQKWNVLGEVCVGIFAKKNIQEDEELTFDYRLDTHKTTLTRCLCGSSNCRQYLGLIPNNYTSAEDWMKKLDNMRCTSCKKTSGADDECLILCDLCNKGWHIYCLKVPLKSVPKGIWICAKCTNKSAKKEFNKNKPESEEIKINLEKKHLDILRNHLDDILEMDVKLFWENLNRDGFYEVTIRGVNAVKVQRYIMEISKKVVPVNEIEDEVTEIEIKFETIFFKNLMDFCNKKNTGIHITFDKDIDKQEIYSIDSMTNIILTGRKQDILTSAEAIFLFLDELVIYTLTISITEFKVIESNFLKFKDLIFPVEVRLSKDKIVSECPHPFFFYSYEERKLIFIGNER